MNKLREQRVNDPCTEFAVWRDTILSLNTPALLGRLRWEALDNGLAQCFDYSCKCYVVSVHFPDLPEVRRGN